MLISDWSSDVCAADLWEPCAGRGTMARPLGESGAVIFTSDRHDYGAPLDRFGSFLDLAPATVAGGGVDGIVNNPPFAQADAMWLHAWEDRKNVVKGQRGAVRDSMGVHRIVNKN